MYLRIMMINDYNLLYIYLKTETYLLHFPRVYSNNVPSADNTCIISL